jgi:hypothetical protein
VAVQAEGFPGLRCWLMQKVEWETAALKHRRLAASLQQELQESREAASGPFRSRVLAVETSPCYKSCLGILLARQAALPSPALGSYAPRLRLSSSVLEPGVLFCPGGAAAGAAAAHAAEVRQLRAAHAAEVEEYRRQKVRTRPAPPRGREKSR